MIVGFCAYSFVAEGDRWLAFAAIGCGFYSFEGLIWLLYPQFVLKLKHSSLIVFGWSRVLFHLCGFAGVTVGYVLVERGMAQPPALNLICLGIVMLLVMTMTYLFTEHDLRKLISGTRTSDGKGDAGARAGERAVGGPYNETASGDGAERDGTLGSGPRAAGETLEHERSVAKLAADHRLSPRETEVLELLAKGRSAPFIAEEFTVSVGTVKTHIRHIYEKLGIHSKQELLDLFERD